MKWHNKNTNRIQWSPNKDLAWQKCGIYVGSCVCLCVCGVYVYMSIHRIIILNTISIGSTFIGLGCTLFIMRRLIRVLYFSYLLFLGLALNLFQPNCVCKIIIFTKRLFYLSYLSTQIPYVSCTITESRLCTYYASFATSVYLLIHRVGCATLIQTDTNTNRSMYILSLLVFLSDCTLYEGFC